MIVKHPVLAGVQYDVPEADGEKWLASGWLGGPSITDLVVQFGDTPPAHGIVIGRAIAWCPTCGAMGTEPCRTTSGAQAKQRHAKREA